jgi:hypothetical protein
LKTPGERDQSIERLLRQSLKTPRPADATGSCLDAETLAAWVDGGLSGAPLEMAQSHVADCERCQSLVGAMARGNVVIPQAESERATRRWLVWLVPFASAAAAIALWVAIPREASVSAPPSGPPAAEVQKRAETKAQPPAVPDNQPVAPKATAPAVGADERDRREAASGVERHAAATPAPELRKDSGRLEADSVKEEQKFAAEAPAAPRPAAPSAALSARAAVGGAISADTARSANVVAQACGPRWSAAPADVASQLTAGSAPSAAVCWLVGRGGVIEVSIDAGGMWRRIMSPEITDLSAVQATDARTASITTADGRMFSTSDGGATWTRP